MQTKLPYKRKYDALQQSQDAGKKENSEDTKPSNEASKGTTSEKEDSEKGITISRSGFEKLIEKASKLTTLALRIQQLANDLENEGVIDV
jgi:hypothetical protein